MANFVGQEVKDLGHTHNAWVKFVGLGRVQQLTGLLLLLFFFTLGINDPEGFEKKLGY